MPNVLTPLNLLKNFFSEFFFLSSAATAEFASYYYEDYFSFSYWLGDMVYRILLVDHRSVTFVFPTYPNSTISPMTNIPTL